MTDLDELLARALDEAVPQPPHELDPASMRTAAAGQSRRRLLAPALAAVAVVTVAVGVLFAVHHRGAPSSGPAGPVRSPARITARVVARLLAAAPTLPGATPVDHPPVKVFDRVMAEPASPNLVRRTRWWTAPGTMSAALRFFRAHPPAGVWANGTTSSAHDASRLVARSLDLSAGGRQWVRSGVYTEPLLRVAAAPIDGGIAIRVDAEAIWLPQRTPAEQIPSDVTSVDVVVDRNGHPPTVRRTLGAATARSLAALVNRQRVFLPGLRFCPLDRGWTDTLTFHDRRGDLQVDADVAGCAYVNVGPRSEHNPSLSGGRTVDRAVLHALGLPRNYGR